MSIEIRPLTPADAPACDAIVASLPYHFGNAEGVREAARAVREQNGLVAVIEGEVVGFLTVRRHFDQAAEITWMAVHATRRGQGIGSALIARLIADLRAADRRILFVTTLGPSSDEGEVTDGYARSRAFYVKHGFVPTWELTTLWPEDPALLLVRPLAIPG